VQESPDLQVLDGFDADGQPAYRSLADALAVVEADRQHQIQEAQAFPAAFSCVLRRGFDAS